MTRKPKLKAQSDKISKGKADEAKKRLEAETKVKEAKAQELAKKLKAQAEEAKAEVSVAEAAEEARNCRSQTEPVAETAEETAEKPKICRLKNLQKRSTCNLPDSLGRNLSCRLQSCLTVNCSDDQKGQLYSVGHTGQAAWYQGFIALSGLVDLKAEDIKERGLVFVEIDGLLVPFFVESFQEKTEDTAILKFEGIDTEN